MKLDGTRTYQADRRTVWAVLNDPAQMAKLMPGVESFDVEDDRHWKANVKIPVSLADFGMKMAARFMPSGVDDLDMNEIIVAMKNGGEEKLVDVEDDVKGEHVEIFIE